MLPTLLKSTISTYLKQPSELFSVFKRYANLKKMTIISIIMSINKNVKGKQLGGYKLYEKSIIHTSRCNILKKCQKH